MIALLDVVLSAAPLDRLAVFLAPEERERAGRFRSASDRDCYVAARAALRISLAAELGIGPTEIRFTVARYGKPLLRDFPDVRFNLSHSCAHCLIGIGRGQNIGVDIERIIPNVDLGTLPEMFLSPAEQQELAELQPELRVTGFFHAWVRKEAYLKGRGDGVTQGLDHFDVSLTPGTAARLRADRRDPDAPSRWALAELNAPPGFAAALAVEGRLPDITPRPFDWGGVLGSPSPPYRSASTRSSTSSITSPAGE
jgi:4'-phosphopantetheinyl transferase